MIRPSCAVIVPVYNTSAERLAKLDECLASLARQSLPVLGIVVDDGSPMRREVELLVRERGAGGCLRYVERSKPREEAKTASGAINYGIDLVLRGDVGALGQGVASGIGALCYLHSDDLLPRSSVELRMAALVPGGYSWGRQLVFDEAEKSLAPWNGRLDFSNRRPHFNHHSALWSLALLRRALEFARGKFGQAGLFDTELDFYEDWDASITVADCARAASISGSFVDEYVYYYRRHGESLTEATAGERKRKAALAVMAKQGLEVDFVSPPRATRDLPWSLFGFLPERWKASLRGLRDSIKRALPASRGAFSFPEAVLSDPQLFSYKPSQKLP